jgi:hypothetical protein
LGFTKPMAKNRWFSGAVIWVFPWKLRTVVNKIHQSWGTWFSESQGYWALRTFWYPDWLPKCVCVISAPQHTDLFTPRRSHTAY